MSGVFLSYSREDRTIANSIIRGLRSVGVSVWWDEDMHSIDWNKELERQIIELATLVVLWTPSSAESDNVKDEARLGLESSKLVNVMVGLPKPPYPFDRVNGLRLENWTAGEPHNGWTRLVQTIEEKVVQQGGATRGEFTGALAREEEARKQKLHNLARAQEALEEAQAREAETTEAAQVAQTSYARAEEQHVRVLEMRATHLILSAATQEFEAARAAKEDADRALRAAKGEVKGAQREVALAKAALEGAETDEVRPRRKAAPKIEPAKTAEAAPAVPAPEKAAPPAEATPAAAAPEKAAPERAAPPAEPAARAAKPAAAEPALAKAAPSAVPAAPHRSGPSNLVIGAAAVILAAGAGAGLMLLSHRSSAPATTTPARTPAPAAPAAKVAASPAPVDAKAEAVKAATPMAGNWAPEGLTCDTPVVVAIKDGNISMNVQGATSTATIEASQGVGEIDAIAEKGGKYVYRLIKANSLSMIDPTGQTMTLSRCGG
ncbi:MAG TPA: TIR domain-containing protein, partial [Caulobacteraceae bacterium]